MIFVPSLSPSVKLQIVSPGVPRWNHQKCQRPLQGWSWLLVLLVSSCAGVWVCWDQWRRHSVARKCKAHASVKNIEAWQSSTVRLLCRHSADHAQPEGFFTAGYFCLLWAHCLEPTLVCTGAHLLPPPPLELGQLCQRSKMLISYA